MLSGIRNIASAFFGAGLKRRRADSSSGVELAAREPAASAASAAAAPAPSLSAAAAASSAPVSSGAAPVSLGADFSSDDDETGGVSGGGARRCRRTSGPSGPSKGIRYCGCGCGRLGVFALPKDEELRHATLNVLGFTKKEQTYVRTALESMPGGFKRTHVDALRSPPLVAGAGHRLQFESGASDAEPEKEADAPLALDLLRKFRIALEHYGPTAEPGRRKGEQRLPSHRWLPSIDSRRSGRFVAAAPSTIMTPVDGGATARLIEQLQGMHLSRDAHACLSEIAAVSSRSEQRLARHEADAILLRKELERLRKFDPSRPLLDGADDKRKVMWIERPRTGPSPGLRFELVEKYPSCKSLFSFDGALLRALFEHIDVGGYITDSLYSASMVRAAAARVIVASTGAGAAAAAPAAPPSAPSAVPLDSCEMTDFCAVRYGKGGAKPALTPLNQFALFLEILTNDTARDTAAWLWGLGDPSTVSLYFNKLSLLLDKWVNMWFAPMDHERAALVSPKALDARFGKPTPSVAIDAMEQFCDVSSNGTVHAFTWSVYKHHTTWKYLVVVNLGGCVVFVSEAYVGSETDDDILEAVWPRLVTYLPRGCVVYVDKGFHLAKVLTAAEKASVFFSVPPKADRRTTAEVAAGVVLQYKPHQVDGTRKVANARIVVENFIGLVCARYSFVKAQKHLCSAGVAGCATRVAFFLCNFTPPLSSGGAIHIPRKATVASTAAAEAMAAGGMPPIFPEDACDDEE